MYSAAISHSSYVAVRPRLSITGLPVAPTACSSAKFCMLRVPICSMSAYSATTSTSVTSSTSVTTGMPHLVAHLGQDAQPVHAEPLERVRRRARLERAAAQQRGAGALGQPGGLERLLGRLDRARAGDEGERVRADRHPADPDRGAAGVVLRGHQLVRRGDPHRLDDAGQAVGVEGLEHLLGADHADDRAHHAAADEGLPAVRLDVRTTAPTSASVAPGAMTMTMRRSLSSAASSSDRQRGVLRTTRSSVRSTTRGGAARRPARVSVRTTTLGKRSTIASR